MDIERIEQAKRLFNETWDLLDKGERTSEENAQMLHKTHASCLLWQEASNPVNDSVGQWQVSHVYAVLGYGEPALLFAELCLKTTQDGGIGPFYHAFAYEALARAYAVLGRGAEKEEAIRQGLSWGERVPDPKDREYVTGEIRSI